MDYVDESDVVTFTAMYLRENHLIFTSKKKVF